MAALAKCEACLRVASCQEADPATQQLREKLGLDLHPDYVYCRKCRRNLRKFLKAMAKFFGKKKPSEWKVENTNRQTRRDFSKRTNPKK